ncbi:hypothetical protein BDQ17DRAFT_1265814 [Cyathus striatus]|nr:hypothetical protein BDQ17DRAFT_1265814 [Cyathus striatus]
MLNSFSSVNHIHCFLHINNLVAQIFICQFDAPKLRKSSSGDITFMCKEDKVLYELTQDDDSSVENTSTSMGQDEPTTTTDGEDNLDGWVDEVAALLQAECTVIEEKLRPVRLILVKVCKLAYKMVYSTTKLLLAWTACLEELGLPVRIIPHDVCTR